MPRVRLGVALLLPAPLDIEVDGLRRALDDGTLGRMPAHLTLVPPVNVREDRLGEALAVLRTAAAATRPMTVALGPPATFLPDNPTVHLPVDGDEWPVRTLRERVFVDPLARPLTWPFIPHVTLADEAAPERVVAALVALAGYRAEVTFERVHLLREGAGRTWSPIADAPFAPRAVIGRGGLPVELTVTTMVDAEVAAVATSEGVVRLVVTARNAAGVAGFAEGWCRRGSGHLSVLVVAADQAGLGIGEHLLAAFRSEAAARGVVELTFGPAPGDLEDLR
ncbi:MAG: 2'-5' RNA ligase family protein [Actinomycetota bacterium]|nr:2'-5' RNA ligase family protein [Actinomycetota bacterium]